MSDQYQLGAFLNISHHRTPLFVPFVASSNRVFVLTFLLSAVKRGAEPPLVGTPNETVGHLSNSRLSVWTAYIVTGKHYDSHYDYAGENEADQSAVCGEPRSAPKARIPSGGDGLRRASCCMGRPRDGAWEQRSEPVLQKSRSTAPHGCLAPGTDLLRKLSTRARVRYTRSDVVVCLATDRLRPNKKHATKACFLCTSCVRFAGRTSRLFRLRQLLWSRPNSWPARQRWGR